MLKRLKQLSEVFYKNGVLKNFVKFTGKHPEACSFIKKETLRQVFSCEFCEIFKNTFFTELMLRLTASEEKALAKSSVSKINNEDTIATCLTYSKVQTDTWEQKLGCLLLPLML